MRGFTYVGLAAFLLLVGSTPAYAYLDPASSQMILQVLLAVLAGAAVGWKFILHKVRSVVAFVRKKDPEKA